MPPLILLRHSGTNELILLDSEDAEPVRTTTTEHPVDSTFRWASGLFEELGGELVLFFRSEGVLHLRAGSRSIDLPGYVSSRHAAQDGRRTLTLVSGGEVVLTLSYAESELPPYLPPDLVPFTGEEDRDFGLFIHEVLSDPERRDRIWKRE
jgi:hypothetical protein